MNLRQQLWPSKRHCSRHTCNDLLPTERVLRRLDLSRHRSLGVQQVALDQIVGSTGRHREFDLRFRPRRVLENGRLRRILQAYQNKTKLPPVLLYKVGDAYFVEDGNHRVSAARAHGQTTVTAHVIEIDAAQLTPEPACTRLGYKV
jgi:hypothetical protein